MRVISANLNGIRSATTKGFWTWIATQNPDIVCVQELKAQEADLTDEIRLPLDLTGYFQYAQKKGYSGVGLYSRTQPDEVIFGFDNGEFDNEGRYVEARFGKLSVVSVYVPSGSSAPERQDAKYRFLSLFLPHIIRLRSEGRELIICGDVNIAHHEIDLKNWKGNLKNSGFLPDERAWLTQFLNETGLQDVYRVLEPDTHQYTWWSNRGQARANNVGWRIDYQLATFALAQKASETFVFTEIKFSDHAPLIIDYDTNLTHQ